MAVTNLVGIGPEQLPLFGDAAERARSQRLNRALDEIRARFGADALRRAAGSGERRSGLSDRIERGELEGPEHQS